MYSYSDTFFSTRFLNKLSDLLREEWLKVIVGMPECSHEILAFTARLII